MHVHPLIVVGGCPGPEEAWKAADGYADELVEAAHVYDYGGPLKDDGDSPLAGAALLAGTGAYRESVLHALAAEKARAREEWDVVRQALKVFADHEDPPGAEDIFRPRYKVGVGLAGIIRPGMDVCHDETFGRALWRAGRLGEILDGSPCADRFLYDRRENRQVPVADEKRPDVYAVLCDFHL